MAMEKKKRVSVGIQKQTPQKRKTKKKKKQFLKKVIDYLTSDSYMYAPLITSPPPPSTSGSHLSSNLITSLTTGPFDYLNRIIVAISTRKTITANQQTNENSANGVGEDHSLMACSPEIDFVDQEGLERAKMVKRIVHRTSHMRVSSYSIDNIEHCSTTSPRVDDFISTKIK